MYSTPKQKRVGVLKCKGFSSTGIVCSTEILPSTNHHFVDWGFGDIGVLEVETVSWKQ